MPISSLRSLRRLLQGERSARDFLFPDQYFRKHLGKSNAVPAFMFHQPDPLHFERICKSIRSRGVFTPTFVDLLNGSISETKSLVLSFDDGWSSVWSIGFPLIRRYGLRMTLFIVPHVIRNSNECRSTLENCKAISELIARDLGADRMLTWGELRAMHASGIVDIQSHSLHHGVVFVSATQTAVATEDGPFPLSGHAPLLMRHGNQDVPVMSIPAGTPLYEYGPALATPGRYLPGKDSGAGRWETEQERQARFYNDLATAKFEIERRVPGTKIRVLAPPWAVMSPDLAAVARATGHELIVLGYPFQAPTGPRDLPLYPRLFGSAIWSFLEGPLLGGIKWLRLNRYQAARHAAGGVP